MRFVPGLILLWALLEVCASEEIRGINEINDAVYPEAQIDNSDAYLTVLELIEKYGYNGEAHRVVTKDNYILQLHRITGRKGAATKDRPAIFLMHGLLASSAAWLLTGPSKSLAYFLADVGYDVWMGNARGNIYSNTHMLPNITKKDYWSFSWHEIGIYDLPASIDYILKETGRKKIFYAGHSQGTTSFFVMASQLPSYEDKIEAMFALAPVAYCSRMVSPPFQFFARFGNQLEKVAELLGTYELKPTTKGIAKLSELVCADHAITQPLCTNIFFILGGYNLDQFNKTLMPTIAGHVPAGASVKQVLHYSQLVRSGRFRQYNYGFLGNWKVYRRLIPPAYDLKKVKVPVILHYGVNDWLSHVRDVHQLYNELGNPVAKFRVPHGRFNHLDFIFGVDVKQLVYEKVLGMLRRYK
ncbi:hypothetical protein KM043_011849 [Ampulex compressa]|nr:hypothetical protein KM043_011849 [Ampulex compressa]